MAYLEYILLFILIALSFFFSGSETSLFSLSQIRIEKIKRDFPRRGKMIEDLLANSQRLLITILICNVFVNILATITAEGIFEHFFPGASLWLVIISMTLMILIFGETLPKSLAIRIAPKVAVLVAPVFWILTILLSPIIFIFRKITALMVTIWSALFYHNIHESTRYLSDEMIDVIATGQRTGIINKEEGSLLGNLINFSHRDISKIICPRNRMFTVSVDTEIGEVIEAIRERRFSRIPVWEDEEENIIGILYAKDLITFNATKRTISYYRKRLLRKPFFVPETIMAEKLLQDFRTTHNHLAIVINEYGGVTGLITMEDVLEQIIGEVVDKDDVVPLYHLYNSNMIELEAKMEVVEFNHVFKTNLRTKNFATVGGYLLEQIKRIPEVGEIFRIGGLQFKVSKALPNKIEKLLITRIKKRYQKEEPR